MNRRYSPQDRLIDGRENGGELFDQMWTVPGLLELFDDSNDDVVVDAIGVDFSAVGCAG